MIYMPRFIPTAPALSAPRHMGAPTRSTAPQSVTVQPGDTLWDVAATQLGSGATDWEIARLWPRWHGHNRDRIGADPGRLPPGTVLMPPPAQDMNTAIDQGSGAIYDRHRHA